MRAEAREGFQYGHWRRLSLGGRIAAGDVIEVFEETEGVEKAGQERLLLIRDDGHLYRRQRREHRRDAGVGRCVVGHVVAVICEEVLEDCGKVHAGRLGAEHLFNERPRAFAHERESLGDRDGRNAEGGDGIIQGGGDVEGSIDKRAVEIKYNSVDRH